MKCWVVKVEWCDIVAHTSESRYTIFNSADDITFGVLFKEFKHKGVSITRILRNAVISNDFNELSNDDYLDIPTNCIINIKRYEKIEIGNEFKVIEKV